MGHTVRMKIEVKLRIANGFGDSVLPGIRDKIPTKLEEGGKGALKMENWSPQESTPNNGWSGFDWYGTWYCKVDKEKIVNN